MTDKIWSKIKCDFVGLKKCWFEVILGLGKTDVRLGIWMQLYSLITILNCGTFNH